MKDTLIRVMKDTWKRLNSLKDPGDTFNDVLKRLLDEHEDSEENREEEE